MESKVFVVQRWLVLEKKIGLFFKNGEVYCRSYLGWMLVMSKA